eukprot:TRINITY_DN3813_c0_g1_i5.p1 TRINITY_DN3813_c0_g1~~TRINITY_DN3813_c0_g1_i5.p1  ORF type:complete len:1110 (+),score=238.90 TRINITY_DN3813_c0_g1_i5:56-3385(+)
MSTVTSRQQKTDKDTDSLKGQSRQIDKKDENSGWKAPKRLHRPEIVIRIEDLPPITSNITSVWARVNLFLIEGKFRSINFFEKLRRRELSIFHFYILPNSFLHKIMTTCMVCAIVIQTFLIPLQIAWEFDEWIMPQLWVVVHAAIDVVYVLDVIMNFFTAFYSGSSSKMVTDRSLIAKRYIWDDFVIHVIALLPLDIISQHAGRNAVPYLRINRLIRLIEIPKIERRLEKSFGSNRVRLIALWTFFLGFAHWSGCMWYFASRISDSESKWIRCSGITHARFTTQYIHSVYWALIVMATIGFGDVIPQSNTEKLYAMFAMMVGATIHSVVLSNISVIIARLDIAFVRYWKKFDLLREYMAYRSLPEYYRNQIITFHDVNWARHKGLDELSLLQELPKQLRCDISNYLYLELVRRVPIFSQVEEPGLYDSIVVHLKPQVALPGDVIIRENEIGKEMYFIVKGEIEVYSERNGQVYATLGDGGYFGDVALIFEENRMASARAQSYCDLLILRKSDFNVLCEFYPLLQEKVHEMVQQKIREQNAKPRQQSISSSTSHSSTRKQESLLSQQQSKYVNRNAPTRGSFLVGHKRSSLPRKPNGSVMCPPQMNTQPQEGGFSEDIDSLYFNGATAVEDFSDSSDEDQDQSHRRNNPKRLGSQMQSQLVSARPSGIWGAPVSRKQSILSNKRSTYFRSQRVHLIADPPAEHQGSTLLAAPRSFAIPRNVSMRQEPATIELQIHKELTQLSQLEPPMRLPVVGQNTTPSFLRTQGDDATSRLIVHTKSINSSKVPDLDSIVPGNAVSPLPPVHRADFQQNSHQVEGLEHAESQNEINDVTETIAQPSLSNFVDIHDIAREIETEKQRNALLMKVSRNEIDVVSRWEESLDDDWKEHVVLDSLVGESSLGDDAQLSGPSLHGPQAGLDYEPHGKPSNLIIQDQMMPFLQSEPYLMDEILITSPLNHAFEDSEPERAFRAGEQDGALYEYNEEDEEHDDDQNQATRQEIHHDDNHEGDSDDEELVYYVHTEEEEEYRGGVVYSESETGGDADDEKDGDYDQEYDDESGDESDEEKDDEIHDEDLPNVSDPDNAATVCQKTEGRDEHVDGATQDHVASQIDE